MDGFVPIILGGGISFGIQDPGGFLEVGPEKFGESLRCLGLDV